jgi:hypothetical protein
MQNIYHITWNINKILLTKKDKEYYIILFLLTQTINTAHVSISF